ncbi:pilus assembly protein PilM [uncultured Clostridium sp.]|uniref:type IV pilus biogenesis protein PilM n=1 Tax=uncultured Clostridium sp. TaxID=59620 RepID=UPI00262BF0A2|nr:pilus assembly protein PilM [uncultured Clostridium sp.]
MFKKEVIALDINEENITILMGHKYDIRDGMILKTPKDSFKEDNIIDLDAIVDVIEPYIAKKKRGIKEIAFCIRGQDIIIRHLVVPNTDEKLMRENVYFELKQFIGEKIEAYYSDFEVINYNYGNTDSDVAVMVVGVKKEKIDKYLELADELGLEVKAIDIFANIIGRVFKTFKSNFNPKVKLSGVLSIEAHSNSIVITEFGKTVIEKYQGYGLIGACEEEIKNNHEYKRFLDSIDLKKEIGEEERKYHRFFKSLVNQYKLLVQFYSNGKVKKNLDNIYLVGSGVKIKGIKEYLEKNFGGKVEEVPDFNDLKIVVKGSSDIHLKDYLYTYGLLLRRD